MGHRFRALDGGNFESVVDGATVERALHESITMHARLAEAADRVTDLDIAQPKAVALAPALEALGYDAADPASWPAPAFLTLHGHLKARAAATG